MRTLALLVLLLASPAAAFDGCTKKQTSAIKTAIADAKALAVLAAANVGDTPIYERWFGKYAPRNAETVRRQMKSIVTGIRTGAVRGTCEAVGVEACESSTFAYVYGSEAYVIHFCPQFFEMPKMADLRPGTDRSDNGTRAGTIIHEISHFRIVGGTDDHCYSRSDCAGLAERSASRAVDNADSYQYFAEDVTYYAINPEAWED